jgi:enamine deaminase RidA (YjgF/YER057c/UK114 family)
MSWGSTLIERLEAKQRMSKIVKHNGTIYLCGQVCADAEQEIDQQMASMLAKVDMPLG